MYVFRKFYYSLTQISKILAIEDSYICTYVMGCSWKIINRLYLLKKKILNQLVGVALDNRTLGKSKCKDEV